MASAATKAYYEHQKANGTMTGIASQVHGGEPIVMTRPLNFVITPSHKFTSCNPLVDKTVLLPHTVLGHWLPRRHFHFPPDCKAWQTGRGVPVEWFTPLHQRHILLQRFGTIPVMVELAR